MKFKVLPYLAVFSLLATSSFAEALKIGMVDMQKTLLSVNDGKKAKEKLEKEVNARKKEIEKEEASIKKMGEDFQKQAAVLSDDARAKKQQEIQGRIMKLQKLQYDSQQEFQKKERDLTAPMVEKIRGIISSLAKEKSYNLILEKDVNSILYHEDQDDLTNEVISRFNKAK